MRASLVRLHVCVGLILRVLAEGSLWSCEGWCEEKAQYWPEAVKRLQKIQLDLRLASVHGFCHIQSSLQARVDSLGYMG